MIHWLNLADHYQPRSVGPSRATTLALEVGAVASVAYRHYPGEALLVGGLHDGGGCLRFALEVAIMAATAVPLTHV